MDFCLKIGREGVEFRARSGLARSGGFWVGMEKLRGGAVFPAGRLGGEEFFVFFGGVVVVGHHEGAGVKGAEVFKGDGDDDEEAGAGDGEADRGAIGQDEDEVNDEGEEGDEAESEGAEEIQAVDDGAEIVGGLQAWADAFNEATLFLEVVGDFLGVEDDAGVEVGEEDDEEEVTDGVDEPLEGEAVRIEGGEVGSGGGGEEVRQGFTEGVFGVYGGDDLADQGGDGEEGGREDDGDDAGGDEFQGQDGFHATVGGVAADALGVVHGDDALGFVDFDQEVNDDDNAEGEADGEPEVFRVDVQVDPAPDGEGAVGGVGQAGDEGGHEGGDAGQDGSEDDHGGAVADSLFGHELTEPHEDGGTRHHGDDGEDPVHDGWVEIFGKAVVRDGFVKDEDVGDGLGDGEGDGDDAGPLVDFAAAGFTVVAEFFQGRDGFRDELDNDGRGDVRGDADEDDTEGGKTVPGDEAEEVAKVGLGHQGGDGVFEGRGVAHRDGDVRQDAIDDKDAEDRQDTF